MFAAGGVSKVKVVHRNRVWRRENTSILAMLLGFRHTMRTGYVLSKHQIEANVGFGGIPGCCWAKRLWASPQQLQRGMATDGRIDIHFWTGAM